ncbi:hypothetical protein GF337_11215 [candidate division KSB1 bacterium]|nr:hypothetical protein [candidate division KSB1 bacterium]
MQAKIALILLLLLPAISIGQDVLTAEDAIAVGLKYNYNIRIARNNARIAEKNANKGLSGFLPTLDVSGNYQLSTTTEETNSPFSFGDSDTRNLTGQIALNWTLFDGFRMFINKSRYDDLAKLGEYQARNIIENTVVRILQAYFNLVQQDQLLDVARNSMEISRTRLNKEQVRNELGSASSTDFLNAQVSFNNDRAAFLNQELQVQIARKNLNILLGKSPETAIEVKKEITIQPLTMQLEEMLDLVQKRNSSILLARQDQKIAEQNTQLMRSYFYPNLFLNSSYSITDRSISSQNPQFSRDIETQSKGAAAGLTLSFNLFNGFQDKIDLQNARLEQQNSELALKDIQNQIEGLVREKFTTFEKQMELVVLEMENVTAAEQNLELQQDRYQIGASSSLEFRDAQVNLTRAQSVLISARYQARITRLEIEQLTGNLELQ